MSPRSEELLASALRRMRGARVALDGADWDGAVTLAYYAALYAARAALSERGRVARSHRGIWHIFRETYVTSGDVEPELASAVAGLQREREEVDYEAVAADETQAEEAVAIAERLVAAVRGVIE